MFRKKIEVKGSTLLKTSEKKKFRTSVSASFFQQRTPGESSDEHDENAMPAELHSALVKGDVALTKATTDNGNVHFEFYTLDKTPVLFASPDGLCPTVYLLWSFPTLLPRLYTHAEVFEKLKAGADLMLPGVIIAKSSASPDSFSFKSGTLCSVCVIGNDAPVAVGRTLMSGADMLASEDKKGKAVHVLHTYLDCLWELGPKTRTPNITLSQEAAAKDQPNNSTKDSAVTSAGSTELGGAASSLDPEIADSSEGAPLDNDTMFLLYFLYAVQKHLRRDDDLPVLASTFYGSMLLSSMPAGEDQKIPIQRTSYKKFSVFLRCMQEDGVISIQEPKKGVENIAKIYRDHELFRRYAAELKSLHAAKKIEEQQTQESSSKVDERPVNIRELRAITATVLPLFQAVNKSLKKGQAMGATDVRSVISSYVKAKQLSNGRMVTLDEILSKCVGRSPIEKCAIGDSLTWETLMQLIFETMTPCVEIEYAEKGKEVRKGKPPSVKIRVARRAGNKKVTMIDNVQAFGIDPKALAQELQVVLAVSSTINDVPGVVGAEVQVQGDQSAALQKILVEKYGIAKKYLQVG